MFLTLLKSGSFLIGFVNGVIICLITNFAFYKSTYDGLCMDCNNDFGFPMITFQSGGLMHASKILWLGLAGNILIWTGFSFTIGLMAYLAWNRLKESPIED